MARIRIRPAGFDARVERPSSLRAQAQRLLREGLGAEMDGETAGREAGEGGEIVPDSAKVSGSTEASGGAASADAGLTELTLLARTLYEKSVMPVRDIASLLGVHERTLYKYVIRGGWRRRYRMAGRDARKAATVSTTDPTASPSDVPTKHVPSKRVPFKPRAPRGAGGRYIRPADAGRPVRRGLKALDPAAEAESLHRLRAAAARADAALSRTLRLRAMMAEARALSDLASALRRLESDSDGCRTRF